MVREDLAQIPDRQLPRAPLGRRQWPVMCGSGLVALHLSGGGGSDLAAGLAPPLTAVAQQSLQSLALQSTGGVCSTLPHLLAYLSTAIYLWLLTSFVLFSNTVPLRGTDKAYPNLWLVVIGCLKLLEELERKSLGTLNSLNAA